VHIIFTDRTYIVEYLQDYRAKTYKIYQLTIKLHFPNEAFFQNEAIFKQQN